MDEKFVPIVPRCSSPVILIKGTGTTPKPKINPAVHWTFTLNNYTNEDIDSFCDICSKCSIIYGFGEEIGKNGTKHLQGWVKFKKKTRPFSIFDNSRFHWEVMKKPLQANIAYCSKDGNYKTNLIKKEQINILSDSQLFDWQKEIIKLISVAPDDRSIHWYWSEKGNIGKSTFCKYLCVKYNALLLSGKSSDMKFAIASWIKDNINYPKIILIDIPRTFDLEYLSYEGIECIKNGLFFNGKYESGMVVGNSPHVVIFANVHPDTTEMSADRWRITELE